MTNNLGRGPLVALLARRVRVVDLEGLQTTHLPGCFLEAVFLRHRIPTALPVLAVHVEEDRTVVGLFLFIERRNGNVGVVAAVVSAQLLDRLLECGAVYDKVVAHEEGVGGEPLALTARATAANSADGVPLGVFVEKELVPEGDVDAIGVGAGYDAVALMEGTCAGRRDNTLGNLSALNGSSGGPILAGERWDQIEHHEVTPRSCECITEGLISKYTQAA